MIRVGPECGHSLGTHAGIGCQVAILGDPTRQGTQRHGYAETLFDALDDPGPRFAAVVQDQTLEDQFQGIGFSLGALRGEHPFAVITEPELHGLELFAALAFTNDAHALTEDTTFEFGADDGGLGLLRF